MPPKTLEQQQQTTTAQPVQGTQDHEDEHDPKDAKAAKNASNASLKKEAAKLAHVASDKTASGTADQALRMLGSQFYDWSIEIKAMFDNGVDSDAGGEPRRQRLEQIKTSAIDNAQRVSALVGATEPTKRKDLEVPAGVARGHFDRFKGMSATALQVLKRHDAGAHYDLSQIEPIIADYEEMLRKQNLANPANPIVITPDASKPEQAAKDMAKPAIAKHLDAIEADLKSLQADNWTDIERINTHAMSLKKLGDEHPSVMAAQRSRIDAIITGLTKIKDSKRAPESIGAALNNLRSFQ